MFRTPLFLLFFLLLAHSAFGQCTKKSTELPAAPELLGFQLGMTKEQIKAKVPQARFGGADPFGVSKTTINPDFDPEIDKTKFVGVRSVSLDLLDDRLTSLWIGFDDSFKAKTVEEFVNLISQSLQLNGNWSSYRSRGRQLRCADFQLIVTTVANAPSFRLLDVGAEDTIAERRRVKEEQDSLATEGEKEESEEVIIGDKQSKTFFISGCQPAKPIAENNKIAFKTIADAEKAGFKLAKHCQ